MESKSRRDRATARANKLPATTRSVAKARPHDQYVSTLPPERPPDLKCPYCDVVLVYDRSHVDGGNDRPLEQRDFFVCATHGTFEYRHRTRKLRSAS